MTIWMIRLYWDDIEDEVRSVGYNLGSCSENKIEDITVVCSNSVSNFFDTSCPNYVYIDEYILEYMSDRSRNERRACIAMYISSLVVDKCCSRSFSASCRIGTAFFNWYADQFGVDTDEWPATYCPGYNKVGC